MDAAAEQMGHMIILIAQALVDAPQEVSVRSIAGESTLVLELRVAKADVGKIIGKQGRTAQAIRTLVKAVSSKYKKRVVLEIIDPKNMAPPISHDQRHNLSAA